MPPPRHGAERISCVLPLLCLLVLCGTARAQVTVPGVLDTPFDGPERPVRAPLLLLDEPPHEAWGRARLRAGERGELTVRTRRSGQGVVDDAHARTQFVSLDLRPRPSARAPLLQVREQVTRDVVDLRDNPRSTLRLAGTLRQPEARVTLPAAHGTTLYIGGSLLRYRAGGTSSVYDNTFTIFPATPPFHLTRDNTLLYAGGAFPVGQRVQIESQFGQEDAPGRLSLSAADTSVTLSLPLTDRGTTFAGAARYALSGRAVLLVYGRTGRFAGDGDVLREGGRVIGTARAARRGQTFGLAGTLALGGSRRLLVFAQDARTRWQTEGDVPDPSNLTTNYSYVLDLRYGARSSLHAQMWGVNYQQQYRASHALDVFYRYGEVRAHERADYTAQVFLLSRGDASTFDRDNLNGHLLRLRYQFPMAGMSAALDAAQVVPSASRHAHSSSPGTGVPGPRSATYGGGAVTLSLEWKL